MDHTKSEVLRYLGRRSQAVPPDLDRLVDDCLAECRAVARPQWTWQLFGVEPQAPGVRLAGTGVVLTGDDIHAHLARCPRAAVLAATLGLEVERLIRRWEHKDLTRSVILDACATQLVEECCDRAEEEIKAKAGEEGFVTNFRYSPGYGDLPLTVQPELLQVLQAGKRIGLTCTDSLILLPRKSVTALVGFLRPGEAGAEQKRGCAVCPMRESCAFRKEGEAGGCNRLAEGE